MKVQKYTTVTDLVYGGRYLAKGTDVLVGEYKTKTMYTLGGSLQYGVTPICDMSGNLIVEIEKRIEELSDEFKL